MDSISDFFKKLCISAKDKEVQKILDQIPDQSSKEQYFYNWFTEQWNLLGGMKEKQNFLFDGNRNLKVVDIISVPLHYTKFIEGKGLITAGYIEIDSAPYTIKSFSFLTGKLQGDNFKILIRYYNDKWQNCNVDKEITFTEPSVMEIPVIPNCKFTILFFTEVDYYFDIDVYANFFFKGISDEIYGDSWDEIKTIGASKNALYNKLIAMGVLIDANTTQAEVNALIALLKHNDLQELNAGDLYEHLTATQVSKLHDIITNLNQITIRDHSDLQNVLTEQHHTKYTNTNAVSAMGIKADDNPLHHDRYSMGEIYHNDLDGLNAGDLYEHISQAQKDNLHHLPSNIAYNITTWDNNLDGATKNVIRDKFESLTFAVCTTFEYTGDGTERDFNLGKHVFYVLIINCPQVRFQFSTDTFCEGGWRSIYRSEAAQSIYHDIKLDGNHLWVKGNCNTNNYEFHAYAILR